MQIVSELNEDLKHQIIVTTHSPEVLRAANPVTLTVVEWADGESSLRQLPPAGLQSMRESLWAVGARLSDVFGADSILWVEGQSEEEAFRLIVERHLGIKDISVLAVRNTGDFQSSRMPGKLIYDIYHQLSAGNALIPAAVGFLFDRDGRSEQEIEDLGRASRGKVVFLRRRMLENYLIHADALAATMNDLTTFKERPVARDAIEAWISKNGGQFVKSRQNPTQLDQPEWVTNVDAARLLGALFQEFSEAKEEFRKTRDSVRLVTWLMEHQVHALDDIIENIRILAAPDRPG
jgi:hypothetical protein